MPWSPPEVSQDQSVSSWVPPEVSGWAPPEVTASETSTATTPAPSFGEALAPDLSSGNPALIANAQLRIGNEVNKLLAVGGAAADLQQAKTPAVESQAAPSRGPSVGTKPVNEFPQPVIQVDPKDPMAVPHVLATLVEHAGAAALNIPAAMYRQATGVTPKTTVTDKEGMREVDAPLPFQPGVPTVNFSERVMELNPVQKLIEGLSTPGMLASFPFGGTRVAQAFFLSQTAPGALEAATRLVSPNTPPDQRQEAATDLLLNGLMTYGIAKHLATTPEAVALAPKTTLETAETIKKTEVQSASTIPNATGVSQLEVRSRVGQETPLRQPGETATQTLTPATDKAVTESTSQKPKESVTAAAVKINGELFSGTDHADAIGKFIQKTGFPEDEVWSEQHGEIESGFLTNTGRFIQTEEAVLMAGKKPGTVSHAAEIIPSETTPPQPGGGLSTKSPEELARHESARLETEANLRRELEGGESATPIGMGGAVPSEFTPSAQSATSTKNARVDAERAQLGLPSAIQPIRREFGTVWDETMAKIDNDPGYPDRLLAELRDNPRALTDSENATLLHRQVDLRNEYAKATRDLAQAFDDGREDAVLSEKARVNALSDQLLDLYDIGKRVGTETGRGLNARKMMALEDFTLAKMELEKRAVNDGRPLTDAERSEVVRLNKRIEETQKAFDEYVTKTEKDLADRAIKDALDEAERAAKQEPVIEPHVKIIADKIKTYFDNRADAALKRLSGKLFTISPQVLADLTDLGVSRILGGAAHFTGWSAKMVEALGEKVKPHLQTVWESSQRALNEHVEKVAGAQKEKVKRAVTGATVGDKITATKTAVSERVNSGGRSEVASLAQKLARLFVEQGVKDRETLIDSVHEALKESDPTFTRRETMDAISGYGQFRQLSKDQISKQLRDLKGQMQQVAKLEDMQAGKPPLKTGIERRIPSPEESRLIKKVNEAKNQFQIPSDDPNTQLQSSLDTLKTRLKNRTIELKDKLARGDFEKKPKRIIQMDAEANRLSLEAAKAKTEWHEALMKDRLAKRSTARKVFDTGVEVLNTTRALVTSSDLSAVLRQGGFIAFGHPVRALKSFPAMFRAFRSEAGQHAVNQEIISRPNYPLYQQGKLYLSEHGQKLSQMEEAYMSRWADKIPLVAGSQRAYVTFLNKLRADSFDAMADTLARQQELTPVEVNAIANFINVATGRGNLGMKENALVGLNTVFFAPRYVASRFQLLAGQPLYRGTARTRAAVAKEYGRFLIGAAVVYALAKLDGATVEDDPRSSDFGKLRYGNTRVDPMAGLLQNTVLLSRLGSGETKTLSGKIVPIRGDHVPFGTGNSADVIARFLRSKLSPAIGTGVNLLTGKDVVGQPVTLESTAESLLIPLSLQDIYKTMIEQGVPRGTAFAMLSILGMGLQNYENKSKGIKPTNGGLPKPLKSGGIKPTPK